jgi:hypothetical protein
MAFIPLLSTIELLFRGIAVGNAIYNVLHFTLSTPPSTTDLDAATLAGIAAWTARMIPRQTTNYALAGVKATDMTTSSGGVVDRPTLPSPVPGTLAQDPLPLNSALVTKFSTLNRGRSFRGRAYLYGTGRQSLADAESVLVATATSVNSAWAGLASDIEAALVALGAVHVVASKYTAGAPRPTGVMTAVSSYSTEVFLDSMRRRLEGRGS